MQRALDTTQITEGDRQAGAGSTDSPKQDGCKETTPRHIIIKMPEVKDKERVLKARENQLVTYRGVPIRLPADFSKEPLQAKRNWQEIFKVMKSKDLQLILLYSAKIFRIKEQIESFLDKVKLKVFILNHYYMKS